MSSTKLQWNDIRHQLRVLLRPIVSPNAIWRASALEPTKVPVRRPVADFLHEALIIEEPELRRYLQRSRLEEWGISEEFAFQQGYANVSPAADLQFEGGLWRIEGDLAASRAVVPGWLAAFRGKLHGKPVAAIPDGRHLYVGGDQDPVALRELIATASHDWRDAEEPLSPMLLTVDDRGRVIPWTPPPNHPAYSWILATRCAFAQACYQAIGELIEDLWSFKVIQDRWDFGDHYAWSPMEVGVGPDPQPRAYTFARWHSGTTLLPQADMIVIADPERGPLFAVRWESIMALVSDHLAQMPDLPLPVYRILKPLGIGELRVLQAHAVDPKELA